MPAFFELLREETEPAVRVVLGHFVFVYIHPYMDGNGRIGRFMMNLMMASGGSGRATTTQLEPSVWFSQLTNASTAAVSCLRFSSRLSISPHRPEG
jgi:Fic family protein